MQQVTAEPASVRTEVPATVSDYRIDIRDNLAKGILDVLEVAINAGGTTDLRQGILTAVYNHDTRSFEIRWDLAK